MISSHVKFSADRQTDTSKTICPDLSMWGHKNIDQAKYLNQRPPILNSSMLPTKDVLLW